MYDINFYMRAHELNHRLISGEITSRDEVAEAFESFRGKEPVVYNIETTNACNMLCKMCPRTTMMTREISTLSREQFIHIIDQLRPWTDEEWQRWEQFVVREYGIKENDMSENHYYLYVIPKVIQLHGYGDPLLDTDMPEYVKLLSERGFCSYFSCNPANIDIAKTEEMFANGLDYIKYSIESVDDEKHKAIRGEASNFSDSYSKIMKLLEIKKAKGYKTTIVITMLDLNNTWQEEEFDKLRSAFEGKDVYIYLKSEDQQWYRQDYHGTKSVHWSEVCKHPWMSMTIKSNAEVAMCMEDFNNEIVLGDAGKQSLKEIWEGEPYREFRRQHIQGCSGIKCFEECDMKTGSECIADK